MLCLGPEAEKGFPAGVMDTMPQRFSTPKIGRATTVVAGLALLLLTTGCRTGQWFNQSVINPPTGFSPSDPAYYNGPAAATLPAAGSSSVNATPVNLAPATATPLSARNASNAPRDTYDVTTPLAQDAQPIRVVERSTTTATPATLSGMRVNDGTQARIWGQPPSSPANSGNNPAIATLRGSTLSSPANPTSTPISSGDGQWKSRSSYESTERR